MLPKHPVIRYSIFIPFLFFLAGFIIWSFLDVSTLAQLLSFVFIASPIVAILSIILSGAFTYRYVLDKKLYQKWIIVKSTLTTMGFCIIFFGIFLFLLAL